MSPSSLPSTGNGVTAVAEWSEVIKQTWARGTAHTLDLARVVLAARERLAYGQWTQLWKLAQMPFPKRKADMLVAIGRNLGRLDAQNFSHLPVRWSILYCLSRLGATAVEQGIQAQTIHSGLTLREAKELLARRAARTSKRTEPTVRRRWERFRQFVVETLDQWTSAERARIGRAIIELADQIGGTVPGARFESSARSDLGIGSTVRLFPRSDPQTVSLSLRPSNRTPGTP